METFDRIARIAARELGVSEKVITPAATRDDIGSWDSLKHLNLLMAVETEFGFRFSLEEMTTIRSIQDLVAHAGRKGSPGRP